MKTRLYFLFWCICILIFGFFDPAGAQIINTCAGDGTPAFGGDGGPAVLAYLNNPYGICVDTSGNLYIADVSNDRIRKVDTFGIITTYAGSVVMGGSTGDGGPATNASLYSPRSVITDKHGNLYFTDAGNNKIRKVDATGTISTIAGNGAWGYFGDGGAATNAKIGNSYGVAADDAGNIYFSDAGHNVIRKIDASGNISTVAGTGVSGFVGEGTPATSAQLQNPYGIAVDGSGNLYIADCNNNRIRKVNTAGIISTIAGTGTGGFSGDGFPATTAYLNGPNGVGTDAFGNIYITDQVNSRVRKVNAAGIITTVAGSPSSGFFGDGGPATAAWLNSPSGVTIARNKKIYIADYSNERIRILDNVPTFTGGNVQNVSYCGFGVENIDSLLAISDLGPGKTETWSLIVPPVHGAVVAAYTAISTGGIIIPVGLSYTPLTGYVGTDTFKVRVTDGSLSDTTIVIVSILNIPDPGAILGLNKVCIGGTITLTETTSPGVWSSSNTYTTVSGGTVNGIAVGIDSIFYTVTNACGSAKAIYAVAVISGSACDTSHTGGGTHTGIPVNACQGVTGLTVYPNPGHRTFTVALSAGTKEETRFVIANILGTKIKEFTAPANTFIDITLDTPPGIYFLTATNTYGAWSGKIVVQ